MIEGRYLDQYNKLKDYVEELRKTNLGSTIVLIHMRMKTMDSQYLEGFMCALRH